MKTLVIDDSRLARNELKRLLVEQTDIQILDEAANAEDAKEKIERLRPDLIFLDIQMPGANGFELLEDLDHTPQVIFTTAYDTFAIKAFEVNALDYLQKPVTSDRLEKALSKAREAFDSSHREAGQMGPLGEADQVFVKEGDRCWFVRLAEIKLLEVTGNYTRIYFRESKPMIQRTLQSLEERLDAKVFFRANRQQIVNLKWIEKIEPWFNGSLKTTLREGMEVEISRRQAARFKEIMSL